MGTQIGDDGDGQIGLAALGVLGRLILGTESELAHGVSAVDGVPAQPQVLAVPVLLAQAGNQRQFGCRFGDHVLVALVEDGDERPRGGRLQGAELGKSCEGGILGCDQVAAWPNATMLLKDGGGRKRGEVPVAACSVRRARSKNQPVERQTCRLLAGGRLSSKPSNTCR